MDSCHSLQCESQKRENLHRRRIGPRNLPPKENGPGENPRPTFEIEENYEVFEERKKKMNPRAGDNCIEPW
ncbi:MAG: hypothetical protein AM326_11570 [Candidatus Thorarchaeota archaeon SMTZ-45]|nr:MAG: hypothetical protein AM326_11570 [Candidatus Thorarchaeota archaeon SMTZ-45]KXH71705.1 MAG: hypothetical protein AM325_02385 [Candidatus Thorarchaeota archaeon SMTZ1-45]